MTPSQPHALQAIVYVSSAVQPLETPQIEHLLERARARNAEYGITGLLLYADGSFMQYIEGPHDALMRVYDIILADPLHRRLIELLREPVAQREFAGWSMAYRTPGVKEFMELADAQWLTSDHADATRDASPGRLLLRRFWSVGQRV